MQTTIGVVAIVVAGLGMLAVLARWRRMSGVGPVLILAVLAAALGTGALLLQDDPGVADWAVTLAVLAVGAPVHFRFMLGPPGAAR
ncbi:MAG TPA: hypothetical protein VFZ96_04205 [Actinomycetota bacterium]|nr:hypothetical protein [Actinomycetota bacterium]